jgi:hypothetical protein
VKNLISTKAQYRNGSYEVKKTVLQRKLDTLYDRLIHIINQLYKISDDDYNTVKNDEMFSAELQSRNKMIDQTKEKSESQKLRGCSGKFGENYRREELIEKNDNDNSSAKKQ